MRGVMWCNSTKIKGINGEYLVQYWVKCDLMEEMFDL